MVEQLNSLIFVLKEKYSQQGQAGKILIPSLGLLIFCCLCSLVFRLIPARNAPGMTPSPVLSTGAGTQPTPTALFGFDATLFPTLVAPTPLPTTPSPATATQVPIATFTPSLTRTSPPATAASSGSVQILTVNKPEEYVEIQNVGNGPVDLSRWKLVSVTGNQPCTLSGILQSNEVIRVWAGMGTTGLSCAYAFNIWNDHQADPAVLYDAQGTEISSYP